MAVVPTPSSDPSLSARNRPEVFKGRHLAVFLATSGHSGVDRIMKNLLPYIASRGILVDLLHVRNHGPRVPPGPNLRWIDLGSAHTLSSMVPLVRYLRHARPDALLSDKDRVNRVAILARILSRIRARTVVRTGTTVSMDLETKTPLDRWIHRLSMRYLYPRADAIISPSAQAAQDLARFVGPAFEAVIGVPNPVVTSQLLIKAQEEPDHAWLKEKEVPVVMGIGELCARKDFETLVRAFALVRETRRVRLLILGEGRRRASLEKLISDLGIQADVQFPGFRANPYSWLARSDLYVHSARYEGFGVSLVEALALGIPVVSTDCPSGPREILRDGTYGRLVPVGDVREMARAMSETLSDPPTRENLLEASGPYTLEASAAAYLRVLDLGHGGSPPVGSPLAAPGTPEV